MTKEVVISDTERILDQVENYLVEQGFSGFVTKENPEANSIEVPDIPDLVANLKSEEIFDVKLADVYVQYTVESNEGTYEDMGTKFIVFDSNGIKGYLPFEEVIGSRNWCYQGLSKDGFRKLLNIMVN